MRKRIYGEIWDPLHFPGAAPADWSQITQELKQSYPEYDCTAVYLQVKVRYYAEKAQWAQSAAAAYLVLDAQVQSPGGKNAVKASLLDDPVIFLAICKDQVEAQQKNTHDATIHWTTIAASVRAKYRRWASPSCRRLSGSFAASSLKTCIRSCTRKGRSSGGVGPDRSEFAKKYPGYACEGEYLLSKAVYFAEHKQWLPGIDTIYGPDA